MPRIMEMLCYLICQYLNTFTNIGKKAQRFFYIQLHTQILQTMAGWQIPNNSHDFFPGICFLKFFRYETIETHSLTFLLHSILAAVGVLRQLYEGLNHSNSQQRLVRRVLVFTLKFEIPQQPIKIWKKLPLFYAT